MRNPKPFGLKTHSHCKRRVAKKLIGKSAWNKFKQFHNHEGLVSSCNGLNMTPKIEPEYIYIGKKGRVLFDIDLSDKFNSCSFRHCIGKPKTYKQCLEYVNVIVEWYKDHHDEWGFFKRYSKIKLNEDGTIKSNDV